MPARRVVITGIGAISALGSNCPQFWDMLSHGVPGFGPIESVDRTRLRFQNGAEVRGYKTDDYFDGERARLFDKFTQFGLIAAQEAVQSAGIDWAPRCANAQELSPVPHWGARAWKTKRLLNCICGDGLASTP